MLMPCCGKVPQFLQNDDVKRLMTNGSSVCFVCKVLVQFHCVFYSGAGVQLFSQPCRCL